MKGRRSTIALSLLALIFAFGCSRTTPTTPDVESEIESLASQGTSTPQTLAEEWGYGEKNGPPNWCGFDYELCCEDRSGATQSPLNITAGAVETDRLPRLQFRYRPDAALDVVHNGHTVQANVGTGDGSLTIGKDTYQLQQFHFHTQSEHGVAGRHLPMEMHLVHKADDGSTAVVGVFIVTGRQNRELEKIWQDLPDEEGDEATVARFNLKKLLPKGVQKTFRYTGSLTTPPCTEEIYWNVFAQPIEMSRQQIREFKAVFSGEEFPNGNRRPTQALNGRTIFTESRPGHGDDDDDDGHDRDD